MTTLLISFSSVRELLMQRGGLRKREAEALLMQGQPPPVAHGLHSRRRWHSQAVLDFCDRLQKGEALSGKGALDVDHQS